ncbi:MAG: HEAT repeat domain-containing protein [Persicimonas sp.]
MSRWLETYCAAAVFVVALLAPGAVAAQQQQAAADAARFSEAFSPAGTNAEVRVTIEPSDGDSWRVRIAPVDNSDRTLLEERIPEWVLEDHYDLKLSSESLSGDHAAVLLSALPGVHGEAPPSATEFQVVWLVDHSGRGLSFERIDTAKYSTLDGGERFELREVDGSHRLIRLRRDEESILCGAANGEPVIFDQFDPSRASFEQAVDIERLLDDAATLESKPAGGDFDPPPLQSWYQWFAASSDQRSPDRRGALIRPLELGDGLTNTGWMEGVDGLGRGEFVSAQINDSAKIRSFRILPGIGGSKAAFEAFARPTKVLVALSDGSRYIADLDQVDYEQIDSGRGLIVELPEPRRTRCMSVMILEATDGKRLRGQPAHAPQTTVIASITPYSVLHAKDAKHTARRVVDHISREDDGRTRQRLAQMALPLGAALVEEVRHALDNSSADRRRRIIPLMATMQPDQAVPLLLEFLRDTDPDQPEYRAIKRSLAAHYVQAAPGLVDYVRDAPPDASGRKYTDVLRLLGRVGEPEHLEQLIEQFGHGPESVRSERVRAVAAGGKQLVEPLLEYANWHVNTDASYDALRALNLIGKRLYYQDQGELPRPELYVALLQESDQRRALMRGLRVARFFEVDGFIELVQQQFSSHSDALVRRSAMETVERYETDAARTILIDALDDPSPDVRIAAVNALAEREDAHEALDELIAYAERERWKSGLQQAFRVLASINDQRTERVFEELFSERPNAESAFLAANALDRAGRSVDARLAAGLVTDDEVSLEMRREMLDILGLDDSEFGEAFLLDLLADDGFEQLSEATHEQERLRKHVMLSLGRRRSELAKPRLLEMAKNSGSIDVQRVALRALAFYKDEALLAELTAWREDADPRLRGALRQTIGMIERRTDLGTITEELDEVLEEDEDNDESETRTPDGASE